jgi:cytochrome c6
MKSLLIALFLFPLSIIAFAYAQTGSDITEGKRLFLKHCAICHPNGLNVVNPEKTLSKRDLDKNGLRSIDSLVRYMMNPGQGMPKLVHENQEITKEQAKGVAVYILDELNKDTSADAVGNTISGKTLFEKHCALCHRDGGNVVNPRKTLKKKDLDASGLKSTDALVGYMMNPGVGMPKLVHEDREITKVQAQGIATYILETFGGKNH